MMLLSFILLENRTLNELAIAKEENRENIRMRFLFSKKGRMRYISHLDLMRLLMRAARRANFPLYFTKGFHPHIKLRFKRALKLGLESDNEEADILLIKKIKPNDFLERFNKQLPNGVRIKEASIF